VNNNNLKYLSSVMQNEVESRAINGSAIRVIHNNKIIYENELGFADKEKGVPVGKDTIYRLYSMSKPITAVATMILYERGVLNLLAPVSDYLEGFQKQKVLTEVGLVNVQRPITIQDLLNMTSGVVYPDGDFEVGRRMEALFTEVDNQYREGNPVNTVDFCNRMGRIPLEFQPGERWRYGASADILGAIIEVASGRKLSKFLQDEIFVPLGMVDTGFYVPEEKADRFAAIYEYVAEHNQLEVFIRSFLGIHSYSTPPAFESGGAGLVSTIEDYSRFAMMLANSGILNDVRILGHKTVEYLAIPQLNVAQAAYFSWDAMTGYSYGNLMRSMVDPVRAASNGSVGEFGWDGWTGNYFFVDPKENLIMIYMIQKCDGGNPSLLRKLRSIVYGAL